MSSRNPGCELDEELLSHVKISLPAVKRRAEYITSRRAITKQALKVRWLVRCVSCMDLTTLSGDDTCTNVSRLCLKAARPVSADILSKLGVEDTLTTAAVCVYPARVSDCLATLKHIPNSLATINIASVATGFPCGQTFLSVRLEEIRLAVKEGASEIDVVINRALALAGDWQGVYKELVEMRKACGDGVLMKTILAVGDLASVTNIYRAAITAMCAGSDFVKTSTGKEPVNAILLAGVAMTRAIRDFQEKTGHRVGIKPAGGIRTAKEALAWMILVREELGEEWLTPGLFRIGASSLLADIESELYTAAFKQHPSERDLV